MTAEVRKKERPSLLSKRVLRTNKINTNEATKLQERLQQFALLRKQKRLTIEEDVEGIQVNLDRVRNVKEKMEISATRRKFLMDHGVNLKVKDVYMEDFITAVDNALEKPDKVTLISNKNNNDRPMSSGAASMESVSDFRVKSFRSNSSASLYSEDNFPLHLPLHMLRKKSKGKQTSFESLSDEENSDDDLQSSSQRISARSITSGISRRTNGKTASAVQYRVIEPPIKGRRIADAYKEKEEEEKLVQKLIEKKKFHDRVKKEESMKKKQSIGPKSKKVSTSKWFVVNSLEGPNLRVENSGSETDGKQPWLSETVGHPSSEATSRDPHSVTGAWEHSGAIGRLPIDTKRSRKSSVNVDEEFEKLMQKSLQLSLERKQQGNSEDSYSEDMSFRNNLTSFPASAKFRPSSNSSRQRTSSRGSFSTVNNSTDKGRTKVSWTDFDSNEEESEEDLGPSEIKPSQSSFDLDNWNELVKKIRKDLKTQEASRPITPSKAQQAKRHLSRISHPTAVDMDEDIIYDARPDKSVAKGYATMHMTVGKKSVSICVPRFKTGAVVKGQTASRASARSAMNVENVREKKLDKKKRATSFE
eukprot:Seg1865.5 transcript_id=Seg1865.5/GoldUCD/mRNA.D3Y31 product="hypothetical protein" protein_id=Seg1865.5/GoldUCD/D3Y31